MGWLRDHLFVVSLSVFLVSIVISALVVGFGGFVLLSALLSGSLTVDFMVGLWPYVLMIGLLFTTTVLSGLGMGWSVVNRISVPRISPRRISQRLYPLAQTMEQKHSALASLSPTDYLAEPSEEEKLQRLKKQYVDGSIDEAEFERRVESLTAPDRSTDTRERDYHVERER